LSEIRRAWAVALLLFAGAWTALSWPWLSGAVTIPWDAKAHFYPQLQFLAQSIHRGEWPFWAPYVFSGSPQIADPQSLIVSPPFVALAALDPDPGFQAFDAVVLGMLGLGGLFILLLFRDRGWHPAGGLVAAIVFAFGASAAWRVQHVGQVLSLALWPVSLWLLGRALTRGSWFSGCLAGIVAGLMAVNRDQVACLGLWLLAGAVAAHLVQEPRPRDALRRAAGPLFAGAVGGALIVLVPIGLTLLLAEGSNRPEIPYTEAARGSLHPALLLTALVPNLFGVDGPFDLYWGPPSPLWGATELVLARNMGVLYLGALPFALLVAAAFRGVLWAREVRYFTIAFLVMLLYALGGATPVFGVAFKLVPGIDFFRRPADSTFFIGAFGAILSGYGVHRLWSGSFLRDGPPWRTGEIVLGMGTFAIALALASAKGTVQAAAWPLVKASVCLGVALATVSVLPTLSKARPWSALMLLLAVLVADLAWNNGPNESTALPPDRYDVLRAGSRNETLGLVKDRLGLEGFDRVELTGLGFHWPNASLIHRMHNVLGYNPVRLGLYTRATGAEDHVALPEQRRFAPLFPSYRSTLANLLGLRLIVTGVPIERIDTSLKPGDLNFVARTADGFIYENPRALPRAIFATSVLETDPTALLKDGGWPDFDPATTVLLPPGSSRPGMPASPPQPASVNVVQYENTAVVIDVTTEAEGLLVLHDPYHPWWAADVDDRETPILQANVLFRAVPVPAGTHRVRFTFRPFRGAWRDAQRRWPVLAAIAGVVPR
jgi:hypothetical protein